MMIDFPNPTCNIWKKVWTTSFLMHMKMLTKFMETKLEEITDLNGLGQQAKMLSVKKGNRDDFKGSDYISINAIFRYIRSENP